VERAFRCIKTGDLQVRPIRHWLADRVRAHVFLCMLAYYLEWHMRQRLAPMLFDDTDRDTAEALRKSVLTQAQKADDVPDRGRTAGTQLSLAAGRSRDLGAQHHHHRDHTKLSAYCGVQTNTDPAEGSRSPRHQAEPVAQRPTGRLFLQFNRLRA
jgi:hypothetical protein